MNRIEEPTLLQYEFTKIFPSLVLASSSPNRRALLEKGGSKVTVFVPDVDENTDGYGIEEAMLKNARLKLEAYLASPSFEKSLPAISADTLVHIDGKLIGKPRDIGDAREILKTLSGRRQTVLTGCGFYHPKKGIQVFVDTAGVVFKELSSSDIENYIATGESLGAAGAYRLQKTGWTLVDHIEGDWTTVVGLPLEKLIALAQ